MQTLESARGESREIRYNGQRKPDNYSALKKGAKCEAQKSNTCVWQFPLIALGMALLLVCGLSSRLPFSRLKIPGAGSIATIAYSAYLIQKLVIHFVGQFCESHGIVSSSQRSRNVA